jgi:hypothetical protein
MLTGTQLLTLWSAVPPKDISNYLPVNTGMRMPDFICSQYLANTSTIAIPQIPLTLFS